MLWNEEKKELIVVTYFLGLHINKKKREKRTYKIIKKYWKKIKIKY
jgi:hypothetical protein